MSDLFLHPTIKGAAACLKKIPQEVHLEAEVVEEGEYVGITIDELREFEDEFSDIE